MINPVRVGTVLDEMPYPAYWTIAEVESLLAPFYPTWDSAQFA
ncbi:hypothetical protein [Austwickia sp. TVS 96-490-7B]|nr:hypothetical protein [Austwickia sp. TVS 96-490-7B]